MSARLLIDAVQRLARSRRLEDVTAVVRTTARQLVGSDGVTFVLRDGEQCHYVDEDAIGPLWKGNRYPLRSCVTGWVMLNKRPVVIPDIFKDDRVPHAAYEPTFVKSLAAVPIRSEDPIGAIGAYWARVYHATDAEVSALQSLADAAATALENVRLLSELKTANERTAERAESLRVSEERLRMALDAGRMRTVEWDLRGSGASVAFPGLPVRVHEADASGLADAMRAAGEGPADLEHEFRAVEPDGGPRWMRLVGRRVRDGDGPGFSGVIRDITDRRRLMTELAQAQKMESIGRLAGGVAHDFNNALTAILCSIELARESGPAPESWRGALESIESAAGHAASLTKQLLAFSRRQVLERKVTDLNALIEGTRSMLARLIPESIEIRSEPGAGIWPVMADREQLVQVIVNLAVNARDAMPGGGRLTIGTVNVHVGPDDVKLHPGVPTGDYAMVTVADTGCGMDQTVQKYIFEPFFTTKAPGQGTGLGLATVHGIVRQHGGHIWLYSEPGKGTVFKLLLPRHVGEGTAGVSEPKSRLQSGTGRVLLVEDEPLVRDIAAMSLRAAGYEVVACEDSEAALRHVETDGSPPAVLVTDVTLPGMPGPELAAKLAARFPGLRVLFTSGYSEDDAVRNRVPKEVSAYLAKPYTPTALTHALGELLARARG